MRTDRRAVLALIAGGVAMIPLRPAMALDANSAQAMIQQAVTQVYAVINSGQPPAQMYRKFETNFSQYADVDIIARTVLGPAARQASGPQFAAYKQAFQGYMGRKYGKRFREFVGGRVSPIGAVIGALTLTLAGSFLSFLRISPDWQIGAQGAILILVLTLRLALNRAEGRKGKS